MTAAALLCDKAASAFAESLASGSAVAQLCDEPKADNIDAPPSDRLLCTNSEFLSSLLAGAKGYGWVNAFHGNPGSDDGSKWFGRPYEPDSRNASELEGYSDRNSYYSVAELKPNAAGHRRRTKENFSRLRALVVDDVDEWKRIADPTYMLSTSPGKWQVGVFIDPDDPDAADVGLVDALMSELYRRKMLGDSSGNNLVRYVRLPNGVNEKPRESGHYQTVLEEWHPKQIMSLGDAAAVFGIEIDELRGRAQKANEGGPILLGDGQDKLMAEALQRVITGEEYHESLNRLAASMVASGAAGGAIVNLLRGLMSNVQVDHDERWRARYNDIPRSVDTAMSKFRIAPAALPAGDATKLPLLVQAGLLIRDLKPQLWLVKDWLEDGAMSMIYGPPAAGKSLIAYDIACCVATGTPWHGRAVQRGRAIVVVGEGNAGLAKRVLAWSSENKVPIDTATPLHISTRAIQFLTRESALELVNEIDKIVAETGGDPPALIVIDTVARNFGPGDENSTKDATAFIAVIDELLRNRYRAHVLLVHHTGKDATSGARGSSVFRAAMDQEFSVAPASYGDVIKMKATKMKDAAEPKPLEFRLKQVEVGINDDDEPIVSVVMESVGSPFDEIIYNGMRGPITLGQVLALREGDLAPTAATIAEHFGLTGSSATTSVLRRVQEGGWIEAGANRTARKKISSKAMIMLSKAGLFLGTPDDEPRDE